MKICAIKDSLIESYGIPIFVAHINIALRSFQDEINTEGSHYAKHASDYTLYEIGEYDEQTGVVKGGQIALIARGRDLKNAKE